MPSNRIALRSALLSGAGFRHAFFMRVGGVSPAPWSSLNFSTTTGDSADRVAENVARAAAELEVHPARIYYLSQVHGTASVALDGTEDREEVLHREGDITVSAARDVTCGVRIADCAPILIADPTSGAVAAVHSGWRGTVQGAARAGVAALEKLTAGKTTLLAAVGPHIERCCFEVGPEVAVEIAGASSATNVIDESRARPHVDLRAVIEAQLREAGITDIDHVRGCTMCDAERFHSFRRDGPRSGRMLAAIVTRQSTNFGR